MCSLPVSLYGCASYFAYIFAVALVHTSVSAIVIGQVCRITFWRFVSEHIVVCSLKLVFYHMDFVLAFRLCVELMRTWLGV